MSKSSISSLLEVVKKTDPYSTSLEISFGNGKRSLKSWFGVITGLVLTAIIAFYAYIKLDVLLNYQDITIMEPILRNHFNDSYAFGSEQEFQLAFAMIGYDESSDSSSGDAYGQIKLYHRVWGKKDPRTGKLINTALREVKTEPCKASFFPKSGEEPNDQNRFYTLDEKAEFDVERNMGSLKCAAEDIKIQGDYNSASGQSLVVAFERCEGKSYCKSPSSIDNWLRRKFIMTVQNEEIFMKSVIDKNRRLNRLATLKWHVVSPQMRTEYVHSVQVAHLNLADEVMDISSSKEVMDSFSIKYNTAQRPYDFFDNVQTSVAFEMNLDLVQIDRSIYGFLDFLGDIGGLAGSLHAFAGVVVGLMMYQAAYNSLSDDLYSYKSDKSEKDSNFSTESGSKTRFNYTFLEQIKMSVQDLCCSKKCYSKRDKLGHKALAGIKHEMKVTEWIKQHRITNHVLKKMHSEKEWQDLESKFTLAQVEVTTESETENNQTKDQRSNSHGSTAVNTIRPQAQQLELLDVSFQSDERSQRVSGLQNFSQLTSVNQRAKNENQNFISPVKGKTIKQRGTYELEDQHNNLF